MHSVLHIIVDDLRPELGAYGLPDRHTPNPYRLADGGTVFDRAYAQQYLVEIVHVLERVPRPMLLLFKTNDCLRHAERKLDAGVDSLLITLRYCLEAMLLHAGVASRLERLRLACSIWLLRTWSESALLGPRVMRILAAKFN